jgi:hypothetical protein
MKLKSSEMLSAESTPINNHYSETHFDHLVAFPVERCQHQTLLRQRLCVAKLAEYHFRSLPNEVKEDE